MWRYSIQLRFHPRPPLNWTWNFSSNLFLCTFPPKLLPWTTSRKNWWKHFSKRSKLKVSGPLQTETVAEKQETRQQIDVDRQLYLQALIVRIMKTRKKLNHNSLIEEIIKEARARFAPSISSIKKCIEGLIEKGYIERDEKSRDDYLYVAWDGW